MPQKLNKLQMVAIAAVVCLVVVTHFVPNSYFFIFLAGSIVVIGILAGIAQMVLKRKDGEDDQPSPLAQEVRQFQDNQENAGWRIEMIPFDDPFKPMMIQTNGIAVAGALAFVAGFALLAYNANQYKTLGICLAAGGVLVALLGLWFKARSRRKGWEVVTARCVDRELKKVPIFVNGHSSWGWLWRIVCEYEYLGKEVRVTPAVYWSNFSSEAAARKFMDGHVAADGGCKLRINPKNLLQAELQGQGIKDKLLY